jgi:hypothetical protein
MSSIKRSVRKISIIGQLAWLSFIKAFIEKREKNLFFAIVAIN